MKKNNAILVLILAALCLPSLVRAEDSAALSTPIQHNGRVKALSTFASQQVRLITGKGQWEKRDNVDLLREIIQAKTELASKKWVRLDYLPLIDRLHLEKGRHFYSYNELVERADTIEMMVSQSQAKRDKDERPSKMEQEAEMLFTRVMTVKQLMSGESLKMIPPAKGGESWESVVGPHGEAIPEFQQFYSDPAGWNASVHERTSQQFKNKLRWEVFYFKLDPFNGAWMAYLASFILMTLFKKRRSIRSFYGLFLAIAFGLHTLGLALRVYILGRPPVSNMFESMVYMSWILMVFAFVFFFFWRKSVVLSAGALISALVTLYGHLLPIDSNLEVLVPVLRSNYWLTIHVMTIVSSYGAFGLATALGHRHLYFAMRNKLLMHEAQESAHFMDRVIQLGVMLLGIGTVLGGVWANESWGRFWGWDPKETWALITFLAYLALIHLRYTNKINDYWTAFCAVLGFYFVLMTWYGVNFVLGRGLHSYGFGSGGITWIIGYLVVESLFLLAAVGYAANKKRA